MATEWENFLNICGDYSYDVSLDKPRQIGAATSVLARRLNEYRKIEEDYLRRDMLKSLIEQMRFFVIGNNAKSIQAFNTAYDYLIATMPDGIDDEMIDDIHMCSRIVDSINNHQEFIDDLINHLARKGYDPKDAMQYLEESFVKPEPVEA